MILTALFVALSISFVACRNGKEMDLHTNLFQDYNSDVKPVLNVSTPIDIYLKLNVMSIDNVNEKEQSFSTRAFLEVRWTDEYLKWQPAEFSDVKTINVPTGKIWLPDLALQDVNDNPTDLGQESGRAVIDYNGSVIIWPCKLFTVSCKITIHYYPFDVQECSLDFLSWTNPSSSMRLIPSSEGAVGFTAYRENGVWSLDSYEVTVFRKTYGNDTWDHIKFTLTLKRKWLFQVMNIIAPIVCISLLNLTCFVVPAESGEKVALCISMFLTLAVILTTITTFLPESSDEVSILGIYVCLQVIGSGISIVCTVISLFLYHRNEKLPVTNVFLVLCKIFKQTEQDSYPVRHHHQNGLRSSNIQMSVSNEKSLHCSVEDTSVSWANVSLAFDRLCFVISVCWNVFLLIGFVVAFRA